MKIVSVEWGRVSIPLRTPFKTALRTVASVEDIIVKLTADTGETGFGEAPPTGVITGARPMYEDVAVLAKGDIAIQPGDQIQFLCDYYGYDGSYESTYKLGSPIIVERGGLEITYSHLDEDVSVTYRLTDIYSNHYWTPAWVA